MKAYDVFYETGGSSGRTTVLVGDNQTLGEALSKKDVDFSTDSRWCRINSNREVPLSTVKIKDLSIDELQLILKN